MSKTKPVREDYKKYALPFWSPETTEAAIAEAQKLDKTEKKSWLVDAFSIAGTVGGFVAGVGLPFLLVKDHFQSGSLAGIGMIVGSVGGAALGHITGTTLRFGPMETIRSLASIFDERSEYKNAQYLRDAHQRKIIPPDQQMTLALGLV